MAMHDALGRRETNAGALELLCVVEPLKRTEQPGSVRHVEPSAVVAHYEVLSAVVSFAPELDARRVATSGEFPCIGKQVVEQRAKQPRVAGHRDAVLDLYIHLPNGNAFTQC